MAFAMSTQARKFGHPESAVTHAGITVAGRAVHLADMQSRPVVNAPALCGQRGMIWYRADENGGMERLIADLCWAGSLSLGVCRRCERAATP